MHEIKILHVKKPFKRNYTLKFNHELNLLVTTSVNTSSKELNEIIAKHKNWIEKTHQKLSITKNVAMENRFNIQEGEKINILEETYTIKIIQRNLTLTRAYLSDKYLIIEGSLKDVNKTLNKLFRDIAYRYLSQKVYEYEKIYLVKAKEIRIKDQMTKWGSCSSKKILNFNFRLIFAPLKVIDYVALHEVCHLIEMNHSKDFWNLVKKTSEEYKIQRSWLKNNQQNLRYIF